MHTSRRRFQPAYIYKRLYDLFKTLVASSSKDEHKISTTDCIMSALALFSLKFPSMLQFDKQTKVDEVLCHNLKHLFYVNNVPCDTQMRVRLDNIDVSVARKALFDCLSILKREKKLSDWCYDFSGGSDENGDKKHGESLKEKDSEDGGIGLLNSESSDNQGGVVLGDNSHAKERFLLCIDGVEFFNSKEVHCRHCCTRVHKKKDGGDGKTKTYYHQALVAVIACPGKKTVIPVDFEMICQKDGYEKNDCERNAAKRLLARIHRDHSTLSFVVCGDGLYSNGPFVEMLKGYGYSYILVAKEGDHKSLNDYFWAGSREDIIEQTSCFKKGKDICTKQYRSMHNAPLNDANFDTKVNVLYTNENLDVEYFTPMSKRLQKAQKTLEAYQEKCPANLEDDTDFKSTICKCLKIVSKKSPSTFIKKIGKTEEKKEEDLVNDFLEENFSPWKEKLKIACNGVHPSIFKGNQKNFQVKKEQGYKGMWVTDLALKTPNQLVRTEKGGRARWFIENQTFNTLKNLGYNFEHNYGHGNNGLSNFLAAMMILTFAIDQILEALNKEFQACYEKWGSKIMLWQQMSALFCFCFVDNWDIFYENIMNRPKPVAKLSSNSS